MYKSFIPASDVGARDWGDNFTDLVTLDFAVYGITEEQSLALSAAFTAYDTDLTKALNPATRGVASIFAKDQSKTAFVELARELARIIQARPTITDQQKLDLGLTVRKQRSPIEPPTEAPTLDVISVSGRTVKARLHAVTVHRGKPAGVAGANIYAFVGANPPAELDQWEFKFNTTRTVAEVEFDTAVAAGSQVWLTACWYNPRAQTGPSAAPVGANLPGGGVMRLAA
jgi:hypothetical protein